MPELIPQRILGEQLSRDFQKVPSEEPFVPKPVMRMEHESVWVWIYIYIEPKNKNKFGNKKNIRIDSYTVLLDEADLMRSSNLGGLSTSKSPPLEDLLASSAAYTLIGFLESFCGQSFAPLSLSLALSLVNL